MRENPFGEWVESNLQAPRLPFWVTILITLSPWIIGGAIYLALH